MAPAVPACLTFSRRDFVLSCSSLTSRVASEVVVDSMDTVVVGGFTVASSFVGVAASCSRYEFLCGGCAR